MLGPPSEFPLLPYAAMPWKCTGSLCSGSWPKFCSFPPHFIAAFVIRPVPSCGEEDLEGWHGMSCTHRRQVMAWVSPVWPQEPSRSWQSKLAIAWPTGWGCSSPTA
jgi:hypothetical protein